MRTRPALRFTSPGRKLALLVLMVLIAAGPAWAQGYSCSSPPVGGPTGSEICDLGWLDGGVYGGNARGVSGDGRAVVGLAPISNVTTRAFRWIAGGPVNPQMQNLGVLDGDVRSEAMATSADGRVVVGLSRPATGNPRAFRWVQGGTDGDPGNPQMQDLGGSLGFPWTQASGVDASGQVVVGHGYSNLAQGVRGFRWVADGAGGPAMQVLPVLTGYLTSRANGVSADGWVAAGSSSGGAGQPTRAMRWDAVAGAGAPEMQDLGTLDGGAAAEAHGADADGSVVVGDSRIVDGWRAFRWVAGGTSGEPGNPQMQNLGTLTGGSYSAARGVSADGRVVVGTAFTTATGGRRAYRWVEGGTGGDPGNPQMQSLGLLPGGTFTEATGVSADGQTVSGFGDTARGCCTSFIWRAETGIVPDLPTQTQLAGPERVILSAPLSLEATVTAAGATPAGRVVFLRDGTEFAAATLDGQGMARVAISTLPLGLHRITARYAGAAGFEPSGSDPLMVTVTNPRPDFSGGGVVFAPTADCGPGFDAAAPHPVTVHYSPSELGGLPSGVSLVWRSGSEHLALWGPMLPSGQFFGAAGRSSWSRFIFYPTRPLVRVVQRQIVLPAGVTDLARAEELILRLRVQNFGAIQGCAATVVATLRRAG